MTEEEQRIEDEALVLLVEKADFVILEYTGTRALLAPDTVADIVRLMRIGLNVVTAQANLRQRNDRH